MGEAFLLYLSTILTDECVGGQKQAAPRRRAAVSLRGTVRAYIISWLVQRRERERRAMLSGWGGMQQLEPKWRMSNAGCRSGMHSNYEYHSLADSKLQRRSCDAKGSHCTHTHYGVITFAAAAGEPGCSLSLPIIIRRVVKSLPLFYIYLYIGKFFFVRDPRMGNISINRKSGITWQIICFASLSYCCFFFVVVFPIVRPSAISQDSWSSAHSFVTSIFIPDPYYILSISASLTCRTYLISSSGDRNLRRYCFLVRVYCISSLWSFYVGRRPASGQKVSSVVGHLPHWKGALIFGWKQVERLKSQFSTKCLLKNKTPRVAIMAIFVQGAVWSGI